MKKHPKTEEKVTRFDKATNTASLHAIRHVHKHLKMVLLDNNEMVSYEEMPDEPGDFLIYSTEIEAEYNYVLPGKSEAEELELSLHFHRSTSTLDYLMEAVEGADWDTMPQELKDFSKALFEFKNAFSHLLTPAE